jgi:hypothetical protein
MSMRAWFVHTITVAPYNTGDVSAKGDPLFKTRRTFRGRVEKTNRLVRSESGREVVAAHVIGTDDVKASLQDRYWLPSIAGEPADDITDPQRARSPVAIEVATDKRGLRMLKMIYFA